VTTPQKRRFHPDYRPSEPDSGLRRWPRRSAVKPDQALAAILECKGVLADAAKLLGMSRSNLVRMAQNSSKMSRVLKDTREAFVDNCEKKLGERVEAGDTRAIIFALSTLGKHRGWTLPKDVTLGLGDVTNVVVGDITIESVPSGSHFDAAGQLVGSGGLTIEHDSASRDEAALADLSNAQSVKPN
jgi:hypothetical protein